VEPRLLPFSDAAADTTSPPWSGAETTGPPLFPSHLVSCHVAQRERRAAAELIVAQEPR
jgi:hypothetical protein